MAPTPADAVATVAVMGSPLVLLPPSEGKAPGGRRGNSPDRFAPELRKPRTTVLEALAKVMAAASESEKSKILRVRGELLERAIVATQRLIDDDGAAPSRVEAIQRRGLGRSRPEHSGASSARPHPRSLGSLRHYIRSGLHRRLPTGNAIELARGRESRPFLAADAH